MTIEALHSDYKAGSKSPVDVVEQIYAELETKPLGPIWISIVPKHEALHRAELLVAQGKSAELPLFGIPFAVKDNIDVAGMQTTAACPAFAYSPQKSATVVSKLEAAGAILIGKTNMDQFATGLVGTRTPYGACSSVFSPQHISGGSSSGSAVAVAEGLVSFSLGTDTAGSGRVPAALNNLIGLKPSRGIISTRGVVPACRSLDCVSIFAENSADAALVLASARGIDAADPYSRAPAEGQGAAPWISAENFRFGVPHNHDLNFFDDPYNAELFERAIAALKELGGEPVPFELEPFLATGRLLYSGPWVAERYASVGAFMSEHASGMNQTVVEVISGATRYNAAEAFGAQYELKRLESLTRRIRGTFDMMLLPTVPRTFTKAEIAEEPIQRNSILGHYTNFVNLLDLAAVAVPAGIRPDGLPFGVSLIGDPFSEEALLVLADRLHRRRNRTVGGSDRLLSDSDALPSPAVPPGCLLMVVVGAHLTGQPLNRQLTDRGARRVRTCRTHSNYRLYALANTVPPKPGLVRVPGFTGPGIEVEVWAVPEQKTVSFVDGVGGGLGVGKVCLEDGSWVTGFLAEPASVANAEDITEYGGWRAYLEARK